MGNIRHPRRGSMQFWPRSRARHPIARVRYWPAESKVKPLGFIAYKAGMTHLMVNDNHPKSLTKGESIMLASTILECPPLAVMGIAFYKQTINGWLKVASIMSPKVDKELARAFPLAKKQVKSFSEISDYDDVRLLVHTNPKMLSIGTKKPKVLEIALGGKKEEKVKYAQDVLGKEITIDQVFDAGNQLNIHGITKGKGMQGTVKRFGVPVRQHKAEKTKRGIGTLGSWHPNRVEYTVAQSGKMGYHLRTEYNKQIIKIGKDGKDVAVKGGIIHYGVLDNAYALIKGSVMGPKKAPVLLTHASRPNLHFVKDAPEVTYISLEN